MSLLEQGTDESIQAGVDMIQKEWDPTGDSIKVEFSDCYEGGWARANGKRIIICSAARSPEFQEENSIQVPDYAYDYHVQHLTVVILHEMGHVLDRRHKLPPEVAAVSDDKEEVANAFARFILERSRDTYFSLSK